jgi:hypothetical protein
MRKLWGKEVENVLKVFSQVHLEKEQPGVNDGWETAAMELIRKDSRTRLQTPGYFETFQQLVWKLAPVSCILAILLCFMLSQTNVLSDYVLVKSFFADPSDLSFFSLYNV